MALTNYIRSTWKSGDVVTATKLNNIENQILSLTKVFIPDTASDRYLASKSDFGIIKIASNNNFSISNGILDFLAAPSFQSITVSDAVNTAALSASGDATISGLLEVTNKLTITASAITLGLATSISSTLSVSGATTLQGFSATNGTLSGTLGVTGLTTLQAVNANNIIVTNGITSNKVTLSAAPSSFDALDLITESRLENYIGNISISPGDGLQGGGALSTSRTLSVKVGANLTIDANGALAGNYGVASTSANGLMSASDKEKLNGIAPSATANTGTVTEIVMNGTTYTDTDGTVNLGTVITDISGKADSSSLAAVALSGNYSDLNGALPTPGLAGEYYLRVIEETSNTMSYIWADIPVGDTLPELPSQDGTYTLQVTIASGTPTYTWIAAT